MSDTPQPEATLNQSTTGPSDKIPSLLKDYQGPRTKILAAVIAVLGISTGVAHCTESSTDTPIRTYQLQK